ncbi:hypothetical protein TNCV_4285611 [Trichonephila clavipes]|nr:hypothetical protein TNCV_4285611 [Trichonephila clavipes]
MIWIVDKLLRCVFLRELSSRMNVNGTFWRPARSTFIWKARRCDTTTVFMQDGAPLHIARCAKQVFRHLFGDDRIISRYFSTVWSPKSPDLNP